MEFSIKELASLSGVSTRTLRYYHEVGLLEPARISSSGYRKYDQKQVDLLQQILFYKEMGLKLELIKEIIYSSSFDHLTALKEHHKQLLHEKRRINELIKNVERTIEASEGRIEMTNEERFEGFKNELIKENEKAYGKEIREKYGNETINKSNQKLKQMTEEQYQDHKDVEQELNQLLKEAVQTGDPQGEIAQKVTELHKRWLLFYWHEYNVEAHKQLAQMYVEDERFKAYYDKIADGTAQFLEDAIKKFAKD
ncbi:MerR family transcriptional regulator [Bacillus carboniphilus]|uniref:MerR family transcriptional regulator n=1 Tax=Bacillus carboniphilus TaxID=86663 RepID=A0ABY9JZ43_9BACI|nr:MerR family transcriptional regulator [Bacillus carboniphilus]WLR43608.1 MerR family transcriptional regulator [Bacillus carboniphilus]